MRTRSPYLRLQDRGRKRQRNAPPSEGWSLSELATLVGITLRTARYYLEIGLLPSAPFRGTATRYGRKHLLVLVGILRLQTEGTRRIAVIKRRLGAMSRDELEAFGINASHSPKVAGALGLYDHEANAPSLVDVVPAIMPNEEWQRVVLAPGLELHVSKGAPASTLRLAAKLRDLSPDFVSS